jgi:REP element-mobilizing transposase RayT
MTQRYPIAEPQGSYLLTLNTIDRVDLFIRPFFKQIIVESLNYFIGKKGLVVYGWCLMTNHLHLIIGSTGRKMEDTLREMKQFTARRILRAIDVNPLESRKEWIEGMMQGAGLQNKRNRDWQFWQQHNHPIELNNYDIAIQLLNYIHNNPVVAGFVDAPEAWVHSSAGYYLDGRQCIIELKLIER